MRFAAEPDARESESPTPGFQLRSPSFQPPLAQFFALQTGARFARLGYVYMRIVLKICEMGVGRSKVGGGGVRRQVSESGSGSEGEPDGECGKPENCHPKNQVSGARDQVSVTRSRGGVRPRCFT
jgi:hypothetical protein